MCWRNLRSSSIASPLNSVWRPGELGPLCLVTLGRGVMNNVRWTNGFAVREIAFPVREQDFSALVSKRPKISWMTSSGRPASPLSYIIIGSGGRGRAIAGPG